MGRESRAIRVDPGDVLPAVVIAGRLAVAGVEDEPLAVWRPVRLPRVVEALIGDEVRYASDRRPVGGRRIDVAVKAAGRAAGRDERDLGAVGRPCGVIVPRGVVRDVRLSGAVG